jgi:hypothetical protein
VVRLAGSHIQTDADLKISVGFNHPSKFNKAPAFNFVSADYWFDP